MKVNVHVKVESKPNRHRNHKIKKHHKSPLMVFSISSSGLIVKGKNLMASILIDKQAQVSVKAVDDNGVEHAIEGLTFESNNPAVATVDQAGLVTGVAPGTVVITANADAIVGDGEKIITGSVEITVTEAVATQLLLEATAL